MTIRLPEPNIFDRFLKLLGKKRGVIIPKGGIYEKFGSSFYAKAYKENFWRALLRPRGDKLPDHFIDIFQIEDFRQEILADEKKMKKESDLHC
jgi:hypothetical protein